MRLETKMITSNELCLVITMVEVGICYYSWHSYFPLVNLKPFPSLGKVEVCYIRSHQIRFDAHTHTGIVHASIVYLHILVVGYGTWPCLSQVTDYLVHMHICSVFHKWWFRGWIITWNSRSLWNAHSMNVLSCFYEW